MHAQYRLLFVFKIDMWMNFALGVSSSQKCVSDLKIGTISISCAPLTSQHALQSTRLHRKQNIRTKLNSIDNRYLYENFRKYRRLENWASYNTYVFFIVAGGRVVLILSPGRIYIKKSYQCERIPTIWEYLFRLKFLKLAEIP